MIGTRLALWLGSATLAFAADVVTKAAPHEVVVRHYAHTPVLLLLGIGLSLLVLGLLYSRLLAIGSGLMCGALCGNGGELVLHGYASDWIPIAGWLTNAADILGALGLLCSLLGFLLLRRT